MKNRLIALVISLLYLFPALVFAQEVETPNWHLKIDEIGPDTLGIMIVKTAAFAIRIAGILAIILLLYSGIKRITSSGSSEAIGEADEIMWAALIGLLIALLSVLGLRLINPGDGGEYGGLTTLKPLTLTTITNPGDTKISIAFDSAPLSDSAAQTGLNAATGNNVARGANTRTSVGQMPQRPNPNSNFLGYKSGVVGGSEPLKIKFAEFIKLMDSSTENPDGIRWRVTSLADGEHARFNLARPAQAHYINLAADVRYYDQTGRRELTWARDAAAIQRVRGLAGRAGFNVHDEYSPGSHNARTTADHDHFWLRQDPTLVR